MQKTHFQAGSSRCAAVAGSNVMAGRMPVAVSVASVLIAAALSMPPAFAQSVSTQTGGTVQAGAGDAVDTRTPDALVRTLSDQILRTIKADPRIKAGDSARIEQVVNQQLLPYTDFRKTTRLALGPGWRTATPEQRDELTRQFELLLIHLYAGAAAKVGDQTVDVKPVHADAAATDVVVQTNVLSQGRPYPVAYRLEKGPQGWKIYDVNVANLWLIAAYRPQFSSRVQASGVPGLISFLQQRNRELVEGQQASGGAGG